MHTIVLSGVLVRSDVRSILKVEMLLINEVLEGLSFDLEVSQFFIKLIESLHSMDG